MTRQFGRITLVGLLLGLCQLATAGEAEDFLKYYSWWEGKWEVEASEGGEVERLEFVIDRHEPGCHLVKGGGIGVWGYDPAKKRWVGSGFAADGARFVTVLERHKGKMIKPGVVDRSKGESWKADGTKVLTTSTWSYIDDNTAELEDSQVTADGEKLPDVVSICKRKPQ